jgi:RecA-family ATPase
MVTTAADLARGLKAKRSGAGWTARCPAHDDHRESLSIGVGENGRLLLKCHAGCAFDAILKAAGVEPSKPGNGEDRRSPLGRIVAAYKYHDARGEVVFRVTRHAPKDFRQWRPDGIGGWIPGRAGIDPVPYRLPKLLNASEVYIVEGEKDCDNLARLGLVATTNPGGADADGDGGRKWPAEFDRYFEGRHVILIPDNDPAGRTHVRAVAKKLSSKAASIRILELPGLPEKGDVSDWIAAGGTAEQLLELADQAPYWDPGAEPPEQSPEPLPPLEDVIDPADWHGKPVPPREWMVGNWIPKRRVTSLYGDGGTGKSTLIQQLGTCTAIVQPWLGLPVIGGRALIVFCEDDEDELHRRQDAINRHYGIDYIDLRGNLRFVERLGRDNLLMAFSTGDVGHLTPFFAQLEAECQTFAPDLVGLDPAADLFGGQEANRVHVRQFIQGCFGKLIRGCPRPATGVLLAHPSQSGLASSGTGYSGSTDWNNAVRSRLYLERPKAEQNEAPDEDARIFSRRKSNYARRGDQLHLRWQGDVFQLDPRIHSTDPGSLGGLERDRCDRVFLDLLNNVIAEGRYASPSRNSPNYAPALFMKRPDRGGFRRNDFVLAMERLFAEGRIKPDVHTTPNRKRQDCIVPVEQEGTTQ